METPNKETRLKHYREVLKSYITGTFPYEGYIGICDRIWGLWYRGKYQSDRVYLLYPEFATFKPVGSGSCDYWFDTTEQRIECLEKCIEMAENIPED
jgi:hypothetical protein